MSEPSPIITPTFQTLLINQLNDIVFDIRNGSMLRAFLSLRILVVTLKPEHKKPLKKNHINHIQQQLKEIEGLESTDNYRTHRLRRGTLHTITPSVLELYEAVIETLHKHGYLEKHGVVPRRPSKKDKLSWKD